jgi:DNA invertase Pin-like site-specific DNA recombinase
LNGGNWRIIAEFTEIESGNRSDRPALEKALAAARVRQAPLVVAKVDRPDPFCRVPLAAARGWR